MEKEKAELHKQQQDLRAKQVQFKNLEENLKAKQVTGLSMYWVNNSFVKAEEEKRLQLEIQRQREEVVKMREELIKQSAEQQQQQSQKYANLPILHISILS